MQEVEDLNKMSDEGWQLVRGGCFQSKFVKNPDIRYRYQLDYQKIDDMARYIEIFREQGWEYVNSTFNGWQIAAVGFQFHLPLNQHTRSTSDSQSCPSLKATSLASLSII